MVATTATQRSILIVDDVPMNIQVLGEALARDYKVKIATSGEAALAIAAAEPQPDLILLDIMMPGMDGYEVCRRLRENPATRHIPVIFVTAKGEVEDEEKGLNLGAVDYISKPFNIPVARARVRNHLSLKLKADLLESMAMIDGLTYIPNRRRFNEALVVEFRRAERDATPLSLIMADIDFFKQYNDHYGHGAGDLVLLEVATALSTVVSRPGDLVARYGGEEFAAILPGTDAAGARQLAEQFRAVVAAMGLPHAFSAAAPVITVSVGFGTAPRLAGRGTSDLIACADQMLYQAKEQGRNQVQGQECFTGER